VSRREESRGRCPLGSRLRDNIRVVALSLANASAVPRPIFLSPRRTALGNAGFRSTSFGCQLLRFALLTAFIAPRSCFQQARVSLHILRMPVPQVRFPHRFYRPALLLSASAGFAPHPSDASLSGSLCSPLLSPRALAFSKRRVSLHILRMSVAQVRFAHRFYRPVLLLSASPGFAPHPSDASRSGSLCSPLPLFLFRHWRKTAPIPLRILSFASRRRIFILYFNPPCREARRDSKGI
jgi:hypothetical protein